jgi:N-acetylneuraminic acid mutarotase
METSRGSFTATLLPAGRVLVAGGFGPDMHRTPTSELYDPATNRWISTGALVVGRVSHAAAGLLDGRVLVVGGRIPTGPIANAEVYDPATGRWSAVPNMLSRRESPTATLLPDGRVLVSGGRTKDSGYLDATTSAEIYDPRTNGWTAAAPMRVARAYHTATLLATRKVLVAGNGGDEGASAELYDPSTNRWSDAARMPNERRSHVAIRLKSGQVLLLGGLFGQASFSESADRYDPASDTWSGAGKMGGLRGEVRAALLSDGRVVVVAANGDAQLYDPSLTS